MAFFRCDVMSESLGMATSVLVTMPDTGDLAAAPVVYLLHGLTDNCTGWLRYTQAEHLARTHGAILIVPEVQRSFYTDMACGPKYFTYIPPNDLHLPALRQSREERRQIETVRTNVGKILKPEQIRTGRSALSL